MTTKIQSFRVQRPWGNFLQFCKNTPATVKIIAIKSGEMLSLQSHAKREEFWRIISGEGMAVIGNQRLNVKSGDELIIPIGTKHRLAAGATDLTVLEISLGDFAEDDITRYEDKYNRA
jgi:mannose-6-phosphate isomerase-like protein (cupin superfamily)